MSGFGKELYMVWGAITVQDDEVDDRFVGSIVYIKARLYHSKIKELRES
jgi:hypothetical protein